MVYEMVVNDFELRRTNGMSFFKMIKRISTNSDRFDIYFNQNEVAFVFHKQKIN